MEESNTMSAGSNEKIEDLEKAIVEISESEDTIENMIRLIQKLLTSAELGVLSSLMNMNLKSLQA